SIRDEDVGPLPDHDHGHPRAPDGLPRGAEVRLRLHLQVQGRGPADTEGREQGHRERRPNALAARRAEQPLCGAHGVVHSIPLMRSIAASPSIDTTSARCGRYTTRLPGAARLIPWTTSFPVTPGIGSWSAAYTSVTTIVSASTRLRPSSRHSACVRTYRWGWKTATSRLGRVLRATPRVTASSAGT